ncbi:DUF5359 family protein [Tuberibacillus sp. Marseille-P3662]|uniref:DUF5359 family protein n=1 Tax=Tuberibacillus sp. Marseille-P3662 TaxID=1965358 RepID=UPI000A1CA584|nr:DUF5359 family protein [Tuberibacillus sp. Marseille-P3662]
MKQIEKWILRLVCIQFVILMIGQLLVTQEQMAPYINKAVRYEGVIGEKQTKAVKTMEEAPIMWYDINK